MAVVATLTGPYVATTSTFVDTTATHLSGVLLVAVFYVEGAGNPISATWDEAGVHESLGLLKRQREAVATGMAVDWWYLLAPTPGSSKTIRVTASASIGIAVAAVRITGAASSSLAAFVRDTTLTGDTDDSNGVASDPVTVTVAGVQSTDLVLDVMYSSTVSTEGANQTALLSDVSSGLQAGISYQSGADGGVMSWTKNGGGTQQWVIAGLAIMEDAGVPGPLPFQTTSLASRRPR
jgi:hypothetical protein